MRPRACMSLLALGGMLLSAVAAAGAAAAVAPGAAPERCAAHRKHGRRTEAHECYQRLIRQSENAPPALGAYWRAEGEWGLGEYEAANRDFRAAVAAADAGPARHAAAGERAPQA